MATQAVIIADTIAGMKKAAKRKAYDSDSDNSIQRLTNRGNKLRKKARFVHEGQLAPPTGPQIYKRNIEHAGFHRYVISRNPQLLDENGYGVDSDDDDERSQRAVALAAEFDPYADVRLEHLFTPLTSASDLPDHPTLAKPFVSKMLTELTQHAGEMLKREKMSLWRIKHLLTRLSGDSTWVPCGSVETENDIALFCDDWERSRKVYVENVPSIGCLNNGASVIVKTTDGERVSELLAAVKAGVEFKATANIDSEDTGPMSAGKYVNNSQGVLDCRTENPEDVSASKSITETDGSLGHEQDSTTTQNQLQLTQQDQDKDGNEQTTKPPASVDYAIHDTDGRPIPSRMRTRAQAHALSDDAATSVERSTSSDINIEACVHPYFLAPRSSHPVRDLGLPLHEAEETRRLLQLYIQKQEEVCRGAQRVYDGLLKADRFRHLVMKWAKAEAHAGPNRDMSDGEDWYDKEEWSLEDELKKGQDEEEEDAAITAKKTRARRQ